MIMSTVAGNICMVDLQCSHFITLYLGSIGMYHVISELCFQEAILERNYRKMTISWSFSYNSFVKSHRKKWEP